MTPDAFQVLASGGGSSMRARRRLLAAAAGLDALSPPQKKGLVVLSRGYGRMHITTGRVVFFGTNFEKVHAATLRALERLGFAAFEPAGIDDSQPIHLTLVGVTAAALLIDTGDVE